MLVFKSLYEGMGLDIYRKYQIARDVIDECESAMGSSLKTVMFEGPQVFVG